MRFQENVLKSIEEQSAFHVVQLYEMDLCGLNKPFIYTLLFKSVGSGCLKEINTLLNKNALIKVKCCSFEFSIYQIILGGIQFPQKYQAAVLFSTLTNK